ncbi:amino acid transporter AVT3B isoform X1 [Lingula anatina]|uniref:Amino acid transporter AVT3B isoform X1 n=1 Tax=Lingula anatina TaxID=7574 RepID=A0A1S3IEC9_LINAN|nr:amino acid transporter AVT3B isoform X1 [Lingula anatina]|eukprot:XP_013395814.1 amino acid transporter AVT3B isoform X1 [Lingula anatina]
MGVSTGGGSGSKNPVKIFANIFISFIGAGVLGLPFAFKEAGIIEGTVIMAAVGLVSVKAMLLVIDCKYKLIEKQHPAQADVKSGRKNVMVNGVDIEMEALQAPVEETEDLLSSEVPAAKEEVSIPKAPGQELNYGDVGFYAMGKLGQWLVDLAILISQVGFCCAYLIFISKNLSDYMHSMKMHHWMFILLPPLYLLTLIRHLSSLALSSLFAQISNLMAFTVVFWFDFEHFHNVEGIHPKKISIKGFPFFLAIAIYCYEGAGMILSLETSVDKQVRHNFKCYFKLTMVLVTALYITFGGAGYLSFGPETSDIITMNLPKGQSLDFAIVVKSCLCLALFFTYPVMMFPVMNILEKRFLPKAKEKLWQGNLLRLFVVTLTGLIVLAIPNFANLMALVGASCCTLLAFILPGLFHLQIFKGSITRWQKFVDIFLIVLGIVGTIVGTWDALKRLHATHTGRHYTTSQHGPPNATQELNRVIHMVTTLAENILTTKTTLPTPKVTPP